MPKYTDFDMPVKVGKVTFRNPFYVASGPTTMTIEQLERIRDTGWGAASLKLTVHPLPYINRVPRYGWYEDKGIFSFTAEKRLLLDELLKLIEAGRKKTPELVLYANITYAGEDGPRGWAEMARKCVSAGAHIVELNMCCPNMSFNVQLSGNDGGKGPKTGASMGSQEEVVKLIVSAVRKAVKVPLFVKLTPEGGRIGPIAKAALEAGADSVGGAANRLAVPVIDLQNPTGSMYHLQKEVGMGCFTGPWVKPLGQRDVYEMRKACGPDAVISGVGGVSEPADAIEYAMCGADLVGICTATITRGFGFMPEFIHGVKEYMRERGHKSFRDMRDILVPAITSAPNLTIYDGNARLRDARPTAPCVMACPNSVPAQGYVRAVANEDFEAAFQLITGKSPLQYACGKVCDHPCEKECTRGLKDEPVMIRAIKRFVLQLGAEKGWKPLILKRRGKARREKVAVVGSGPAGLSCAFDLARAGYKVTVFEAAAKAGGMLRYGIPDYRFDGKDVDREVAMVKSVGVKFQLKKRLGKDFTVSTLLKKDGFSAIFLGIGAQKGAKLGLKGEDAPGNLAAVDLLRAVAEGKRPAIGRGVAVIGGGFTAVDAARTARRLGAKDVYILYRRTRAEMPATEEEVWEAEEEGVKVLYLVAPREIVVENGKVAGIRLQNHTLEARKDPSGRRRPVEVPGTEFTLDVDTVVSAIGQAVDLGDARQTPNGTVEVEDATLATSIRGVYAGGDCVLGPKDVIAAVAQGKKAAVSIDKLLAGEKAFLDYDPPEAEVDKEAILGRHGRSRRAWRPELANAAPSRRLKGFEQYAPTLTQEQAVKEASRCLACGCGAGCQICHDLCKMFAYKMDEGGRVHLDEDKCVACGICAQRCPNKFIEMVQTAEKPI